MMLVQIHIAESYHSNLQLIINYRVVIIAGIQTSTQLYCISYWVLVSMYHENCTFTMFKLVKLRKY